MIVIILIIFVVSFLLIIKSKKTNKISDNFVSIDNKIKIKKSKFINKNLEIIEKKIGNDKKIIIIENFLKNPNEHIEFIKKNIEQKKEYKGKDNYPGVRIKTNKDLIKEVRHLMLKIASMYYDKNIKKYVTCYTDGYSVITHPNNKITPSNMIPHQDCQYQDGHKISGVACVIYLCNTTHEYNGTGFYECEYPFTSKKFWTDKKYEKQSKILQEYSKSPEYCIDKEEHIFKKIYEVDAKINRMVLYPTDYFHQGIAHSEYYNDENNIRKDRYTYAGFVFYNRVKIEKEK